VNVNFTENGFTTALGNFCTLGSGGRYDRYDRCLHGPNSAKSTFSPSKHIFMKFRLQKPLQITPDRPQTDPSSIES